MCVCVCVCMLLCTKYTCLYGVYLFILSHYFGKVKLMVIHLKDSSEEA